MPDIFMSLDASVNEDKEDNDPKPHKDSSSNIIEHVMDVMRVSDFSNHSNDDVYYS